MSHLYAFLRDRWQGRVAWTTLFWRDLLLLGTLLQATATLTALVLLSKGAPTPNVLAVHLLPMPYALFVVAALWRLPTCPGPIRAMGLGWLALAVVV